VLPSAHEELAVDATGNSLYLGYVLYLGDRTFYHSGDCVPFTELDSLLMAKGVQIALLPVNGRDEFRRAHNVPGNFTIDEALAICEKANIQLFIPHHFGMFEFNTVEIEQIQQVLENSCITFQTWIPKVNQCLLIQTKGAGTWEN
jgi:L-ascorbate metabolism protein UlaG (beta-lactamase superfamily)